MYIYSAVIIVCIIYAEVFIYRKICRNNPEFSREIDDSKIGETYYADGNQRNQHVVDSIRAAYIVVIIISSICMFMYAKFNT